MIEVDKNVEYQQAISQIEQKTQSLEKPKTSAWVIYLFLTLFPPVAFYLLWKNKVYHGWFAGLNWTFGASLVLFGVSFNFYVLPKITAVLANYTQSSSKGGGSGLLILTAVFGVLQIVLGFVVRGKFKKDGVLPTTYLAISIIFFILDYVLPSMVYSKVITPIYSSILP